jgi:hypothetical protein
LGNSTVADVSCKNGTKKLVAFEKKKRKKKKDSHLERRMQTWHEVLVLEICAHLPALLLPAFHFL